MSFSIVNIFKVFVRYQSIYSTSKLKKKLRTIYSSNCRLLLFSRKFNSVTHSTNKFMDLKAKSPSAPMLVVDTDPGTDDALALYMLIAAHKRGVINLLGITCVCGNTSVDNATRNALRVLQSVNKLDIPVYRGASEPLIVEPKPKDDTTNSEEYYHGVDGFGDSTFAVEPDMGLLCKEPGVLKLIELARKHKGKLNVVCLGPLTNLALAIKSDPEFAGSLEQLYIMGGNFTAQGNVTSAAEFNFHHDPEAAHIVLASAQCHITMAPWETCMHLGIPYTWRKEVLGKAGTPQADLLNRIEESVFKRTRNVQWYPCDAVITAVLLRPSMVTTLKTLHLTVELHGGRTRGQVVVDHLEQCVENVRLVKDANVEILKQLLLFAVDHPDCNLGF